MLHNLKPGNDVWSFSENFFSRLDLDLCHSFDIQVVEEAKPLMHDSQVRWTSGKLRPVRESAN